MSRSSTRSITSIAIISGCELVGDGLIKLHFLRALRGAFPRARIDWITSDGPCAYGSALRGLTASLIDRIIERPAFLPSRRQPWAKAKTAPFHDLILDTRGMFLDVLFATRLPHRIFLSAATRFILSDRRPCSWFRQPAHILDRLSQLLELAAPGAMQSLPPLPLDPGLLGCAGRLLQTERPAIGLAPGAGNPCKAWPLENFIALARMQLAERRVPVFLLGPEENTLAQPLAEAVPEALFPLQRRDAWGCETLRVEETVALGRCLTLAVANDSGTSHMLAAADCPMIGLFGPTDPAKLAPRLSHRRILKAQDFDGTSHMSAIPVEAAARAVGDLLSEIGKVK